jgi:uncharacterized glyoxalase superfamily protein PhnB
MIFDCRPVLHVDDVGRSLAHYRDVLGFTVGWRWSDRRQTFLEDGDESEDVGTALVGRDKVQFILVRNAQGRPGVWLHLDVDEPDNIDGLYQEWLHAGATILEPPSVRPWGMYETRIQDLDGHVLRVSSPPRVA